MRVSLYKGKALGAIVPFFALGYSHVRRLSSTFELKRILLVKVGPRDVPPPPNLAKKDFGALLVESSEGALSKDRSL